MTEQDEDEIVAMLEDAMPITGGWKVQVGKAGGRIRCASPFAAIAWRRFQDVLGGHQSIGGRGHSDRLGARHIDCHPPEVLRPRWVQRRHQTNP